MSKISGVIHQALPTRTRVLSQEKLIDFLQVQKFDQLLAHQYCVRRFLLHHPSAFRALRSIRSQIEAVLAETPLTNEDRLFIGRRITATARCMRMLALGRAHSLVEEGGQAELRQLLESEIEPDPKESTHPILGYLSSCHRDRLTDIVANGCKFVADIQHDLNFFDYYDPFALSNLVSGKSMLTHYLAAKHGVYSVRPWAEQLRREHFWSHTLEAELDDEMSGIVCENAFLANQPSNVRVFGHNQHSIRINGVELENHLILAVPTDRTPTHIDAALRGFRNALKEANIDTRGCYANVSSPEYDNSLFMRNFDERIFLIRDTKQYQSRLCGLWMWDVVHKGLTIPEAMDELISEAEEQTKKLAPNETLYDSSTYKNLYDQAVKQISPKPTKRSATPYPRELDRYLTSGPVFLGRRTC